MSQQNLDLSKTVPDDPTTYDQWVEREGLPVFKGFSCPNLNDIQVHPWPRTGAKGVLLELEGTGDSNSSYVCEIPAGKAVNPERHLYEEVLYILKGRGATTVWYEGGPKVTFEWHEGSLFAIPPNAMHQHFNGQGDKPARFYAVTTAPLVMNLFHDQDFIFNNPFAFQSRFNGKEDFFSGEGKASPGRLWETNFVADVRDFPLKEWKERGAGGRNIYFELGKGCLCSHISEFPVGTYKKAHRHMPGAHVIIVAGQGYSLYWEKENDPYERIDWQPGSVMVPPNMIFHQHFNKGGSPARYMAIRWGSIRHPLMKSWSAYNIDQSTKEGGNQIEYEDEDPYIRQLFETELAKNGVKCQMPAVNYRR